jgi:ABC-type dipeptide/oligopeptide/nickel transport system permease subunit
MATAQATKQAPKRRKKESNFTQILKRLATNPVAMAGLIVILLLILASIMAPLICTYGPYEMDFGAISCTPNSKHWFGCDQLGRDIFSRIVYGGRYSLSLGLIASLFTAFVGNAIGIAVGYAGGKIDNIAMRICDIISAIPGQLLAIVISTALGAGFGNTILALSIGGIPGSVRNSRAMCLRERQMEYLEAAQSINVSKAKIMFKHMMPNIISPAIVGTTMSVGGTITQAAGLSFIGLGIQPPTPEWGAMLSDGRNYILTNPHFLIFPGLMIGIVVLCINLFGDGLRDAMDPKLKK